MQAALLALCFSFASPAHDSLSYREAQALAAQTGKKLVVFVGCKAIANLSDVAHVAEIGRLDDYPAKCVVISENGGSNWHATLPGDAAESDIRKKLSPELETDALDSVNEVRMRKGLRPFNRCPELSIAAHSAASYRAERRMAGHTPNDFAHLPPGTVASAAGCAAWPVELGWGACCTYENWTYAGAAWVLGADGQRYMHLFVR